MAERHSYRYLETRARVGLARALALAGDVGSARREADTAECVARDMGFDMLATQARALSGTLCGPPVVDPRRSRSTTGGPHNSLADPSHYEARPGPPAPRLTG